MKHENSLLTSIWFVFGLQLFLPMYERGLSHFYQRKSLEIQLAPERNRQDRPELMQRDEPSNHVLSSEQNQIKVTSDYNFPQFKDNGILFDFTDLSEFFKYIDTFDYDMEFFHKEMMPNLIDGHRRTQQTVGIKLIPVFMLNGLQLTSAVVAESDVPTLIENNQYVFSAYDVLKQYSH